MPTSKTAWYRSLYWRIGLGFVLFLAAVLAVQGGTLVWLISRMEIAPGQPPPEVTRLAARDLSEALTGNPQLDIQQFLRQEFEGRVPLVAVMKDGRVISSDGTLPPGPMVNQIRARLRTDPESFGRGRGAGGRGLRPGRPEPEDAPRTAEVPRPRRAGPIGVVTVNGETVGVVMAMPRSALRQLGPTLALVGIVLVAAGTTIAAI